MIKLFINTSNDNVIPDWRLTNNSETLNIYGILFVRVAICIFNSWFFSGYVKYVDIFNPVSLLHTIIFACNYPSPLKFNILITQHVVQ